LNGTKQNSCGLLVTDALQYTEGNINTFFKESNKDFKGKKKIKQKCVLIVHIFKTAIRQ